MTVFYQFLLVKQSYWVWASDIQTNDSAWHNIYNFAPDVDCKQVLLNENVEPPTKAILEENFQENMLESNDIEEF